MKKICNVTKMSFYVVLWNIAEDFLASKYLPLMVVFSAYFLISRLDRFVCQQILTLIGIKLSKLLDSGNVYERFMSYNLI